MDTLQLSIVKNGKTYSIIDQYHTTYLKTNSIDEVLEALERLNKKFNK